MGANYAFYWIAHCARTRHGHHRYRLYSVTERESPFPCTTFLLPVRRTSSDEMTRKLAVHEKTARRPIGRACTFCHRKHLQCDPGRPCQNCIKRGVADGCENVERKRAKYLSEAEKLEQARRRQEHSPETFVPTPPKVVQEMTAPGSVGNEAMFPDLASFTEMRTQQINQPTVGQLQPQVPRQVTKQQTRTMSTLDSPDVFSSLFANQEYAQLADLLDNNSAKSPSQSSVTYSTDFQTSFQTDNNTRPYISLEDNSSISSGMVPNLVMSPSAPDYTSPLILRHLIKSPEEVYTSNLQPYNYPKAYHALLDYLRKRFNKSQLMQIAETMAAYRPSFIAATRSLVEMDHLFAERSFQRSLLEYESMSSLSSSPTIMWRRTGEVVAVSAEFSSLTSHTKTEVLSKRTFIIELMNDSSALDYFRLFSSVAFGDLNGVIITECTLVSPMGEPIRCASTWTVKRDVFDIPMLIVGQFLPILQVR